MTENFMKAAGILLGGTIVCLGGAMISLVTELIIDEVFCNKKED